MSTSRIDKHYVKTFTMNYMAAGLTLMTDEANELTIEDIHPATKAKMEADCATFIEENRADLEGIDPEQAGTDFWLTRCGAGAGFWDRGLEEVGDRLSNACGYDTKFPNVDLYVGDDGKVHA